MKLKKFSFNFKKAAVALSLALVIACGSCALAVSGEENTAAVDSETGTDKSYQAYSDSNRSVNYATDNYAVPLNNISTDNNSIELKGDILYFKGGSTELKFNVDSPETKLYYITVNYAPNDDSVGEIKSSVKIDGEYPFEEAADITIPRIFKDNDKATFDDAGNQFAPEQIQYGDYVAVKLSDNSGIERYPYRFLLTTGRHEIELNLESTALKIKEILLEKPDALKAYSEISEEYKKNNYKSANSDPIIFEAENTEWKNSRSIVPKSDYSADVSPSDAVKQVINYIGSTNWKTPGEEITWAVDVENAGLYTFNTVYKQTENINANSYRILKIDGEIPFAEAANLKFYYATSWKNYLFADENGEPYKFYFEKGKHTISLSATLGETVGNYRNLKAVTENLSDLYLDIAMITSDSPDANRDYELFKLVKDFEKRLEELHNSLSDISDTVKKESEGKTTSFISAINNMDRVIENMRNNLYTAHTYLTDYYNNYTTLSTWLTDMKSMPLDLDRIYLSPADNGYKVKGTNIFTRISFSFKRFFASFLSDYNGTSSGSKKDTSLKIWVNWGRDQAMVLNSLIEESFTPQTGISVNLEITDATLVKGIISNSAPDLALHMARTEPVNLAMRGALCDLTEFSDYNEVAKRFGDTASIPYKYSDGVYALPDTQGFYLMFYRTDIFKKLNLEVPKTWEQFLKTTAVLQRNNMQAWIPYTQITTSTTVNTGVGGLNLFPSILQQFGYSLYDSRLERCDLDSAGALNSFMFWTDMYTKYKIPTSASFYNRFKVGTMPLGIDVYTIYTQLKETAPEIEGKWAIELVPGTEKSDGSVDHTVSGSGTGCGILSSSKHKDEAWEFLKWWTSDDVQLRYNNNVESILGAISRVTTSNLNAFESMTWDSDALEILNQQRSMIKEIPEVPGSYYVSRAVDQAFWSVVNGNEMPKDALLEWNDIANNEIARKIKQYSE